MGKIMRNIPKTLQLLICTIIIFCGGFLALEGTDVSAVGTASYNFNVSMSVTDQLALTCQPATSTYPNALSPTIAGVDGGTATSSIDQFNCTTTSNDNSGWQLSVHVTSTPAMTLIGGADSVADHTITNSYNFASVAAGEAKFGFAASTTIATDLVTAFRNNGSACGGAGTNNSNIHCWSGFNGNTPVSVIDTTHATASTGQVTKFTFKVKSGATRFLTTGTYNAHVNITVVNK